MLQLVILIVSHNYVISLFPVSQHIQQQGEILTLLTSIVNKRNTKKQLPAFPTQSSFGQFVLPQSTPQEPLFGPLSKAADGPQATLPSSGQQPTINVLGQKPTLPSPGQQAALPLFGQQTLRLFRQQPTLPSLGQQPTFPLFGQQPTHPTPVQQSMLLSPG